MVNWKTFTEEELKLFQENPYVKSVTATMIRFTAAFEDEFWRLCNEEYRSPRSIMEALGFDPDVILGSMMFNDFN